MEGVQEIHSASKVSRAAFFAWKFSWITTAVAIRIAFALLCHVQNVRMVILCFAYLQEGAAKAIVETYGPECDRSVQLGWTMLDWNGLNRLKPELVFFVTWLVSKSMSFLRRTASSQVGIFCGFARCGNCGRSQAILDRTPFRPFITCRSIPQRSIYLPSLSQHCLGTDGQELLASIYNKLYSYIHI